MGKPFSHAEREHRRIISVRFLLAGTCLFKKELDDQFKKLFYTLEVFPPFILLLFLFSIVLLVCIFFKSACLVLFY